MENFTFENKTRIIFGKETEKEVGKQLKEFGATKVLLHYGKGHIKKSGLYDLVVEKLNEEKIAFVELSGVKPNPVLSLVHKGIDLCKKEKIDFILAVGGGSVIDSAKAIAMGVPYNGDVWDFYTGKASAEEALPIATILTIPAAGSESSMFTVITEEKTKRKYGTGFPVLRPIFSILNPELTASLPDFQTACGISDMLAHTMERYFVSTKNTDVTDSLCEAHMRSIIKNAKLLLNEQDNYNYRAEIMQAGWVAHNDWLDIGRTRGDWASHMIEHELSAEYDIAHGAGLAIIFPAWMKHVYQEDTHRFAVWARNVFGIQGYNEEDTARLGIIALEEFYMEIGLPIRMAQMDIGDENISKMTKNAFSRGATGNFKKLIEKDIKEIYMLALE